MAQAWSATRIMMTGLPGPTIKARSAAGPTAMDLHLITGPASSVSSGMAVTISSDAASRVYGAAIVGHERANSDDYEYRILMSSGASTYSTTSMKIRAIRTSTGGALSSGVSLSTQKLFLMRWIS